MQLYDAHWFENSSSVASGYLKISDSVIQICLLWLWWRMKETWPQQQQQPVSCRLTLYEETSYSETRMLRKKGSYYYVACHKTQFLLPSLLVQTVIYGILGIRLLEEFELVFRLKQVWKDSPRLSSSVRSIILQQNYLLIYEMWY